ncbi:Methyltransferase domain-containing protein [Amycolatopsis xylanica]|uniref:Methyltransferase domain-containing protein n=1 Tax=Amycolatopsis xylanica TaxID=589385 RepID=A0A1H3PC78_9PSEU|nr:class I SAM-dependent methyltransferase [Amycolatopsis xylanica]SDY98668.1 Methyltransferase domain-containing protein [Amycolatopsis xylanica]
MTLSTVSGLDAAAVRAHPLCGPAEFMPARYRGPHRLGHLGWLDFTSRLERGEETSLVCSATAANERVLDVGGGTGELTRAVAVQLGHCTTVEPHSERVAALNEYAEAGGTGTIEILPGRAESLPFTDGTFDAVIATWILPYVDDLERAVREMARVCDPRHPAAKIVLIGGAPDNELVSILNQACVPLAGEPHDHQGHLLAVAAGILAGEGFGDFTLYRTEASLRFPEPDPEARVHAAAETLVNFWFEGHPAGAELRRAVKPVIRRHFERRPHAIGDQGTVLVARPRKR